MADTPKFYRVYSLIPRAKQDDYWACIGTATPHRDGLGFSLTLNSLPMNGEKLVMRAYDRLDHEQDESARQWTAKKTMGSEPL